MPALLIRQRVRDPARWRQAIAADRDERRAYGARGERQFVSATDPAEVVALLDWDDLDRARLYAVSDDLQRTLARAGAIDPPCISILADDAC